MNALRSVFLTLFLAGLACAQPQTVLIPQVADGGGWQTTFVLTNTTINAGSATLTFYQETSGGATQSWNLPFVEAIGGTAHCSLIGRSALRFLYPWVRGHPRMVAGHAQAPGKVGGQAGG